MASAGSEHFPTIATPRQTRARVRNPFKRAVFYCCERSIVAPWMVNSLWHAAGYVGSLRDRYSDRRHDYTAQAGLIGSGSATAFSDHQANFFARLLLQGRYAFVVELGALDLARGTTLAALFPSIKVYGLDVTQDFAQPRRVGSICIGPNNRTQIADIARANAGPDKGRGLLCARGTLCYYAQDQLRLLFADGFAQGFDIAVSEPSTKAATAMPRSWRRTHKTFYHPYGRMLRETGYELPDGDGGFDDWVNICGFGETRNFIFAQHPSRQL